MARKPEKSGGELFVGCVTIVGACVVQAAIWAVLIVVIVALVKWALIHV